MMTHQQLCERAAAWLRSNRKCEPVLTKIASCREIPDAIGWSSSWKVRGSTVIECKTSRTDFYADAEKYIRFRHPEHSHLYESKGRKKKFLESGYIQEHVPNMGTFRFFMCEPGIIDADMILKSRPDHGLLYADGRRVKVIVDAPRRTVVDLASEVHYLRFGLIHVKDNLLRIGCSVSLTELTKFFGKDGITLPTSSGGN